MSKDDGFWDTVRVPKRVKVTFYTRKKPKNKRSKTRG